MHHNFVKVFCVSYHELDVCRAVATISINFSCKNDFVMLDSDFVVFRDFWCARCEDFEGSELSWVLGHKLDLIKNVEVMETKTDLFELGSNSDLWMFPSRFDFVRGQRTISAFWRAHNSTWESEREVPKCASWFCGALNVGEFVRINSFTSHLDKMLDRWNESWQKVIRLDCGESKVDFFRLVNDLG